MSLKMESVCERDIDLMLINKFLNNKNLITLFTDKIGLDNYQVLSVEHSVTDNNGETDILVILLKDNKKIALLIEDKINGPAMPEQYKRYFLRGDSGIEKNLFDEYYVFLIAPQRYLDHNNEAQKYENKISYEVLAEILKDDIYAGTLINKALEKKNNGGYLVVENVAITKFWKNYYRFIDAFYPTLKINKIEGPRGSKASWPVFTTGIKGVTIVQKSDRGFIDLEFAGLGEKICEFNQLVGPLLGNDMTIEKTNKSLSIRIRTLTVNFEKEFSDCYQEIKLCLDTIKRLQDFAYKLDIKKIMSLKA